MYRAILACMMALQNLAFTLILVSQVAHTAEPCTLALQKKDFRESTKTELAKKGYNIITENGDVKADFTLDYSLVPPAIPHLDIFRSSLQGEQAIVEQGKITYTLSNKIKRTDATYPYELTFEIGNNWFKIKNIDEAVADFESKILTCEQARAATFHKMDVGVLCRNESQAKHYLKMAMQEYLETGKLPDDDFRVWGSSEIKNFPRETIERFEAVCPDPGQGYTGHDSQMYPCHLTIYFK